MANGNDFSSTVDSLFKGMDAFLTSKSVVGDPIQVGDTTIIPLCDVNFGVGAGALGGKLSPSAMIVVKDGYAQIVNVNEDKGSLGKVLEMIPGTAEKLKAILNNRTVTDKEVEEIKEIAEDLTEEF